VGVAPCGRPIWGHAYPMVPSPAIIEHLLIGEKPAKTQGRLVSDGELFYLSTQEYTGPVGFAEMAQSNYSVHSGESRTSGSRDYTLRSVTSSIEIIGYQGVAH
jgi:hypothetical protein